MVTTSRDGPSADLKGLLVGFGSIGRRHLTNFQNLGVRDWAVVHTGRGTLPLEAPCPVRTYADLETALEKERPTFAIVANPTNLHVRSTLACIEADCHVLVEKPVSHSIHGLADLEAAAAAHSAKVLVGFQFRFHRALRRIEEILGSGSLGAPLHVLAVWSEHLPSWHPWEDWRVGYAARADLGGGVHHTICHPLDYLRMLFGEPTKVLASLTERGPLQLDVAEAADIVIGFGHGVEGVLHLDYWGKPPTHRVDIVFTEGTVRWDYINAQFLVWDQGADSWRTERFPGVEARNELFVSEARHFLNVIEGREEPVCSLRDGIAVTRLCDAIERAAATGAQTACATTGKG